MCFKQAEQQAELEDDNDDSESGCHHTDASYPSISSSRRSLPTGMTLRRNHRIKRNAKEKFLDLVARLVKIANLLDEQINFTKLSAALINVIMMVKPLISKEKFADIYKEEPRPLLHPRRVRRRFHMSVGV